MPPIQILPNPLISFPYRKIPVKWFQGGVVWGKFVVCFEINSILYIYLGRIINHKSIKMKKLLFSLLVTVNLLFAQENTGPELWITFQYTPKIGMYQKFV